MKASKLYLAAAQLVHERGGMFSCNAIYRAVVEPEAQISNGCCDEDHPAVRRYRNLFIPSDQISADSWLLESFDPNTGEANFSGESDPELKEWRMTALCLMSAIVADEERARARKAAK